MRNAFRRVDPVIAGSAAKTEIAVAVELANSHDTPPVAPFCPAEASGKEPIAVVSADEGADIAVILDAREAIALPAGARALPTAAREPLVDAKAEAIVIVAVNFDCSACKVEIADELPDVMAEMLEVMPFTVAVAAATVVDPAITLAARAVICDCIVENVVCEVSGEVAEETATLEGSCPGVPKNWRAARAC